MSTPRKRMTSRSKRKSGFALTEAQRQRLFSLHATLEEGEDEERLERLRQREEDAETLRAVAELLTQAQFAEGRDLNYAEMARLLALVRALAPNPNLDRRILHQPDEPAALNRDLRDLLYGDATSPVRLRNFLTRRRAGGQTALQWLCVIFPNEWPLVTQAGLRALELSQEQQAAAIAQARQNYSLDDTKDTPDRDPILRLLAEVETYRAVREIVGAADFVTLHRLLTQGRLRTRRARKALSALIYSPATVKERRDEYGMRPSLPSIPAGEYPRTFPQEESIPAETPDISGVETEEVLRYVEAYIAAQGFTYPPLAIRDYYLCLQTRPFALLSGLSGTGKTRLTSLFAEALTRNASAQYRLLPVRPDWADSTPLLGYMNLLASGGEGRFVSTPFLDFLLRAARPENRHRAFFLCLDEMNLARVEHYLAEVLSTMETPTRELLLPNGYALRLPANLFLTGTLNLDEATYSLSRKVLDRANVLTFRDIRLGEVETQTPVSETIPSEVRQAVFLNTRITEVRQARERLQQIAHGSENAATQVIQILSEANELLEAHGMPFAYRVRDDVLRYCAHSFDSSGQGLLVPDSPDDSEANLRTALDLQLMHRILPRLSGSAEQVEPAAQDLHRWAERSGFTRTSRRLSRFLARLQRAGFASIDEV